MIQTIVSLTPSAIFDFGGYIGGYSIFFAMTVIFTPAYRIVKKFTWNRYIVRFVRGRR